ncbi:MAG TPA: c-type cytochrome [Pirellulales bacterium]|jgi:putative heme-binding domain-containing protein|nr:c-type cytochrome [Pirellulales bacterium]
MLQLCAGFVLALIVAVAAPSVDAAESSKPKKKGPSATGIVAGDNRATPVERIKAPLGFRVELVYSVPMAEQGSWINLCTDPKGRILASDQYGGLYRFAPPAAGKTLEPSDIECVPAEIRAVNGMTWAFDALYVTVNDYEGKLANGLYRVTDSDGDDQLDRVELLRAIDARGDHGVHAVIPAADGKSLYVVVGNAGKPVELRGSRVPLCWGEDDLLPRLADPRGFMGTTRAPAGIIYRASPDGKAFEIVSVGLRNCFDAAVDHDGELFTFDADEEADFNTPWFRPTRICHITSGSEFGWRSGAGKRPAWYPDSLPPVIDIGPGSPTGMTFGYGAKFPTKYQQALYALDWSWGRIYAVHLRPAGASCAATKEEFITGAPLPVTDMIVHPGDGAMYFAIGGRKVQSGLYRVTYAGAESTAPTRPLVDESAADARKLRQRLEAFHGHHDPEAVSVAWPYLADDDRFVRWAAWTAIEHQPPATWSDRAFAESDPGKQTAALLALARAAGVDPEHRRPSDPPVDTALQTKLLTTLVAIDPAKLAHDERLVWLRAIEISLHRFGAPEAEQAQRLRERLEPLFPARSREENWLLSDMLVYLQSPRAAVIGMALIDAAATQEEQIEYARSLRKLDAGWTVSTRSAYFRWLLKAAGTYRGGESFRKFIEAIRADALARLSESERAALADVLAEQPLRVSPYEGLAARFAGRPRTEWSLDTLVAAASEGMRHRNFDQGRQMFGAAACFACHRFRDEGGMTGPDLSSAGRRYAPRDLLDQILNPSKEINEQYVPLEIITNDEQAYRGVVVNLTGDSIVINTDPTDPSQRVKIDRKEIASLKPSRLSPMPTGLLAPLTSEEILDLLAYVLSGGDPTHPYFDRATGE